MLLPSVRHSSSAKQILVYLSNQNFITISVIKSYSTKVVSISVMSSMVHFSMATNFILLSINILLIADVSLVQHARKIGVVT